MDTVFDSSVWIIYIDLSLSRDDVLMWLNESLLPRLRDDSALLRDTGSVLLGALRLRQIRDTQGEIERGLLSQSLLWTCLELSIYLIGGSVESVRMRKILLWTLLFLCVCIFSNFIESAATCTPAVLLLLLLNICFLNTLSFMFQLTILGKIIQLVQFDLFESVLFSSCRWCQDRRRCLDKSLGYISNYRHWEFHCIWCERCKLVRKSGKPSYNKTYVKLIRRSDWDSV